MSMPSEQVKDRLDIAEVIGGYMRLAPAGANLKGLCPFHHEKTPSFYVSKEKQIWHCFGCNQGGDIFSFVMKMDGLEFSEALRMLADRAGIVLRQEDPRVRSERTRMHDLTKVAMAFYEETLAKPAETDIKEYLKRRSLAEETRENFHLGYAPAASWDALVRHLKFKGYRPEEIERGGLAVKNDRGEYRDRFHNRVMFPLFDAQGAAVGFSGRHFEPRHPQSSTMTPAKYVNSPETLIYSKSKLLYGLHTAKNTIREKQHAVLVEGQFDLILSHQAGVAQAVATSGTALTEDHVRLLKRYTTNIYTAFDSDAAGEAATSRSVLLLLGQDMAVRVIRVEGGKDPADIVAEHPQQWVRAVDAAEPLMEHYFRKASAHPDFATAQGKRKIADELLPMVRAHANPVLQSNYLSQLAGLVGTDPRLLQEAMRKLPEQATNNSLGDTRDRQQSTMAPMLPANRWTDIEEFLIAFLVKHREASRPQQKDLSLELFTAPHTRDLFGVLETWLSTEATSKNDPDLSAEQEALLARLHLKADRYAEALLDLDADQEIRAFIHELQTRKLREKLRNLSRELAGANTQIRQQILEEFQRISIQLQQYEKYRIMDELVKVA